MAELLSGFIGLGINMIIDEILTRINTAVNCRKELESLKDLVIDLQGINSVMQTCRVALNSRELNYSQNLIPYDVNKWFQDLDKLLRQAHETVQHCTIPTWDLISRYKMSVRVANLTSRIKQHREKAAMVGITIQLLQWLQQNQISSTSVRSEPLVEGAMHVEERLIIGQEEVFLSLEQLLVQNTPRIGVVGKGGSGKTLLLKRLFNRVNEIVFSHDLLLWVTVSTKPSFAALRSELQKQISFKLNERPESRNEEVVKKWIYGILSEKKFILFLDDVWETSASQLLEELCVSLRSSPEAQGQSSNVIIVSSRSHRALLQMGIPTPSPAVVDVQNLMEDDSWKLFCDHTFPYNDGNLPPFITEEIARSVCEECGGLPLAIKVIGRAMSAVTRLQEWDAALRRLQNAQPISSVGDGQQKLYGRLRLSYDSLADINVSLQLCFLYLAAFSEDHVISTYLVRLYWTGEGLLGRDNTYDIAQSYVNLLADRCLIEVVFKDIDGMVTRFRVHDVLHDLARHISLTEESCFFQASRGLEVFPDFGAHLRISLWGNKLSSVPNSVRGPHISSLIMASNIDLKVFPTNVIASMTSLQILDLSWTSLQSLPKNIGRLKHLICLRLQGLQIKRLPNSVTSLYMLQILDLYGSSIEKLPSTIHRFSSLRILNIGHCKKLQCVPHGISKLISLEELLFEGVFSSLVSINDLSVLKHVKRLSLFNNGQTVQDGILGNMIDMDKLYLKLTMMESLPQDISSMTKLRQLTLICPDLTRVELRDCRFQQLSTLTLLECEVLKDVRDLYKLVTLKQLTIVGCPEIEELPKEFGERGAFPKLEVLNLFRLDKLGELPKVDEAAMPLLQTLSIVGCESLKMVADGYWNLKSMKKIGIYGCSMVLQNLQQEEGNFMERNRGVQTTTMSWEDTQAFLAKYDEMRAGRIHVKWGEFWSKEFYQTLYNVYRW